MGAEVPGLSPGTRVALCFLPACGACRRCREGRSNLCETNSRATFAGTALDGRLRIAARDGVGLKSFLGIACFAEHCVVPAASAVAIPDGLALWQASLIGCAVVTGFGAVRNAAGVAPGESVCVVGCGGVGLQVAPRRVSRGPARSSRRPRSEARAPRPAGRHTSSTHRSRTPPARFAG